MNSYKFNSIFFFVALFCNNLLAQSPCFINYTVEDGLPSSEAYCIKQDVKGYIWIATDRGVSKFDGYSFKNYTTENGLLDNTIFDIYEDKTGKIWFLSYNGKLAYFLDGKIYPYKWNHVIDSVLPGVKIARSFQSDKLGSILISYLNRGILSIDEKGRYKFLNAKIDTTCYRTYFARWIDNEVFVGSVFNNVNENLNSNVNFISNNVTSFNLNDTKSNSDIRGLIRKNGSSIVSLSKYIFSYSGNKIIKVFHDPTLTIHNIYEDIDSNLWIGTRKNGVIKVNSNEIPENNNFEVLLKGKSVTSICGDNEKGFWFATLEDGIFYCPSLAFRTLDDEKPTHGIVVSSVTGGENGIIYVGFKSGVVYKIRDMKILEEYDVNNIHDASDYVQSLFYDRNKKVLWVGTSKNLWKIVTGGKPEIILDNSTRSILMNKDGELWVAGLNTVKIVDEKIIFPFGNSLAKRTDFVYSSREKKVWLGEMDGLYFYDNEKLRKETNTLLQCRVKTISSFSDETLIVGTLGNGIIIKKGEKCKQISTQQGLSGNMVSALYVDKNTIWVSNNGGLDKITFLSEEKYSIENFNFHHGLPTNEIHQIYKSNDTLWLATGKGLVYFIYSNYQPNKTPPKIYIESILLNNSRLNNQKSEFSYDENHFTFNFMGIAFKMKKSVQYKYRLKGLSEKWLYTKSLSVNFAALAPGNYLFEVYAQNEDGIWSDKPATYSFIIYPPFWKTGWFYFFEVLIFFMIVFAVYLFIQRRILERNRIFEFQQQTLTAQMNPHFIFNSLYSIQSFVLKEDRLSASKYLSKFSSLMRKSLEHSKSKLVSLQNEMELLQNYMDLEKMRYREKFDYELIIPDDLSKERIWIPTMILQPFIENAIMHGVIHRAEGEGKVKIKIVMNEAKLICSIEDNGIGRKKAKELKKDSLKKQSYGISITEERLKIMCRELKCEYYLKVEDKYDSDLQAIGTLVTFNLPYKEKDVESHID